jgi:hypothetical protein
MLLYCQNPGMLGFVDRALQSFYGKYELILHGDICSPGHEKELSFTKDSNYTVQNTKPEFFKELENIGKNIDPETMVWIQRTLSMMNQKWIFTVMFGALNAGKLEIVNTCCQFLLRYSNYIAVSHCLAKIIARCDTFELMLDALHRFENKLSTLWRKDLYYHLSKNGHLEWALKLVDNKPNERQFKSILSGCLFAHNLSDSVKTLTDACGKDRVTERLLEMSIWIHRKAIRKNDLRLIDWFLDYVRAEGIDIPQIPSYGYDVEYLTPEMCAKLYHHPVSG